ncbi:hypothetical protein EDC04DRAFT_2894731 [Pisolithus marmoratus]|nr:hypothetical protein EDC04DRAFT_2894731 [Pisolithus marmoratus]
MRDYWYITDRLEEDGYRITWNRLTYFPNSQRLMISSPSTTHESVLGAITNGLARILATIPVSETSLDCLTVTAHSVMTASVHANPHRTIIMFSERNPVGEPVWLMESAFSQSDCDVMRTLHAYVQEVPGLLVVGKILIKQAQQYYSPGSSSSVAPRLRSSDLMTQREWTRNHQSH